MRSAWRYYFYCLASGMNLGFGLNAAYEHDAFVLVWGFFFVAFVLCARYYGQPRLRAVADGPR